MLQQETFALFIDLKKAFDTARHNLLEPILCKFDALPALTNIVARFCNSMSDKINTGGKKREVDCTCSMRQGNNMLPVIFLFCAHAAMHPVRKHAANKVVEVEC